MNTTMAPLDPLQETRVVELRRRHESVDKQTIRRRDNGGWGGSSNDEKRWKRGNPTNGSGNGGGPANSDNPKDNSNLNNSKNTGNGDEGGKKAVSDQSPKETTSPSPPSKGTTVIIISSTPPASSSQPSITEASSTEAALSLVPTTVLPPVPFLTSFSASSDQPQNGLQTEDPPSSTVSSSKGQTTKPTPTKTATVVAQTALGYTATSTSLPAETHIARINEGLSPTAEHLLIVAGTIGALIMIIAGIYILIRAKKVNKFPFRNREFRKGGEQGWYGWRRKSADMTSIYLPTTYLDNRFSYNYSRNEKLIPSRKESEATASPAAILQASPAISEAQLNLVRAAASFGDTGTPRQTMEPITQRGYTPKPDRNNLAIANTTEADETETNTFDSTTGSAMIPDYNNTYNTYNTNATYFTNNTSNLYDPNQRDVNHLSYLSSLSSGFGDQIIIPEGTTPANTIVPRQSRKFSWASSAPGMKRYGNRDTIMTTASEDTPPRFRTVNSWVAQQTTRVERQKQADNEVSKMPELPAPLQIGIGTGPDHQRKPSEDPAFRHHPGDEIQFKQGPRVPSAILDRKTGVS